jgi:lon-related putative ATP-dependent protease
MLKINKLLFDDIDIKINLNFDTTDDLEPIDGLVGQERAVNAIKLGFSIAAKGYNIYAAGSKGCGKTSYAVDCAKKHAKTKPTPSDYCYVYNFNDPKKPNSIKFEAGKGKIFKDDMDTLSAFLENEIPKAFLSEQFEHDKSDIMKNYQGKRDGLMDEMEEIAASYDFGVKTTNTGIYFMPIVDGKIIGEDQYDMLEENLKSKFSKHSDIIQDKAAEIMRLIKDHEKHAKSDILELEYKVGLCTISKTIEDLKLKYEDNKRVVDYLDMVKDDVLDNIEDFVETDEDEEQLQAMLPWVSKKTEESVLNKYKVNLFIDNGTLEGAPVINDFNPTYYNLTGEIEYDNEFGNLVTDFMKIKPGLLHKANGGFLILQASDLLTHDKSWDALRLALKTSEIEVSPIREQLSNMTQALKPEPIPLDIKIVLAGPGMYYDMLCDFDDDFEELFKVFAEFDYEMDFSDENVLKFASYVKRFTAKEKTLPFDKSAVSEIIKQSLRLSERRDKLSTQFGFLNVIMEEAVLYAGIENLKAVDAKSVIQAVAAKETRAKMYEEKVWAMYKDNYIKIDVTGKKVGEVNGLTVVDTPNHAFGCPVKITATTYIGSQGIINIEKEADMSGSIHDKGLQVLSGYFGQTYAQDFPLSLSAKICFEQNYSQIDGDSASCAELLAVLSSLSDEPVNQGIAVTGSVNQIGEVQAVGGVSYKIEGFYNLCKIRGLTGTQGVVIPESCINDLVLKDEVLSAVRDGLFHVYSVKHINEAIELLMDVPAGKQAKGKFEPKSIHYKAHKKLKTYFQKSSIGIEKKQ